MTDRFSGFVVTLEKGLRTDDARATLDAIRQLKGIVSVEPVIQTPEIIMAEERVKFVLREKLLEVLR